MKSNQLFFVWNEMNYVNIQKTAGDLSSIKLSDFMIDKISYRIDGNKFINNNIC